MRRCADGALSLFDFAAEAPITRLHSYFGAVLACAWSADARYLVSGGQDDLIALWDVRRRALVARGVGHRSWITAAAFSAPPAATDCHVYRLATCAADCRVLLWELEGAAAAAPLASAAPEGVAPPAAPPARAYRAAPALPPCCGEALHAQPISALLVGRSAITTADVAGVVRVWARPEGEWLD